MNQPSQHPMGPLTEAEEDTRVEAVTKDLERRWMDVQLALEDGKDVQEIPGPNGEWTGTDGRLYLPRSVGWEDVTYPAPAEIVTEEEYEDLHLSAHERADAGDALGLMTFPCWDTGDCDDTDDAYGV
ncbi:MAG: hypothetical protein QG597_5167 [Actinomycetota bacterium]|nr:hypothetical protein [Actinomycetota bacterium]